jgi:hypothetical protein
MHPRLSHRGAWRACGRTETGVVHEQAITREGSAGAWRCVELRLDTPTEDGETTIRLWTNLPARVSAAEVAALYRRRWRIEGLFQRLEGALHSEIASLGHPRAALLGFAVSLLAYNVLALIGRCVEQAQPPASVPPLIGAAPAGVGVPSRPQRPGKLRGHADRPAARALDLLARRRPERRRRAPAATGASGRSQTARHQQANAKAESRKGLRRWEHRPRPCRNRSGPRTRKDKTLKGVALRAKWRKSATV